MDAKKIMQSAAAVFGAVTIGASLSACGKKPEDAKQPEAASAGDDTPRAYVTEARDIPGIGLRLYNDNGKFLVAAVLDNSPASDAFIQIEDQILKIGDKDTSKMSFAEAIEKLEVKDGKALKLEVQNIFGGPRNCHVLRAKGADRAFDDANTITSSYGPRMTGPRAPC